MGDAGFFKGTSSEQDTRFKDKEKSLLKSINFPKELDQKVDMRKVELSVMRPWITDKIMELLGFEDEVVVEYVNGLLDDPTSPIVDPKRMQINLTGFLESKTGPFMSELWALLISAQQSPLKVPALFIEQKKEEMRKKEEADLEAQAVIKRRQEQEEEKERRLAEIRRRERAQGNNRGSNQGFDNSQRNGSRADGAGGYGSRGNFMPPRGRDSGWGSRGEARLPDNSSREPPSGGKRERSRSRSRTRRRDSHTHKENATSSRRSRSPSRSRYRSRSRSPPSRRTQRRASPSPRPYRRHEESSKLHRRGSPHRGHRGERAPLPKPDEERSSSSGSPPRSSRRQRMASRSPSRPSRRQRSVSRSPQRPSRRERSVSKISPRASRRRGRSTSKSPPRPSRRRERSNSRSPARPSRQRRSSSRSRSPPRRRVSELSISNGGNDVKSSDRRFTAKMRNRSSSPPRKRARDEPEKRRDTSNPPRSPHTRSSAGRSSSGTSRGLEKVDEDDGKDRHPPVISIKGRAAKSTTKSEVEQPKSGTSGEEPNTEAIEHTSATNNMPDQTRSQKLTEVVKERLLREKVKASMNQI
ncbi:hypothetical protein PGT21_012997 [Puccinia graminis f. sp. tritici]|uniref:PWI domain-containing protein n=1 Tax=Puccinia graminis f. sp. tritici TaxID=56615 RepID=A0A5B0MER0_PUCGR|nr:hypothetical protein PGT21_012997 [Puccinia graminis f. sp. tritici]